MNYLDKIRLEQGIKPCKEEFRNILNNSRRKAVILLNDNTLSFPTFYILMPQIEPLYRHLTYGKLVTVRLAMQFTQKENLGKKAYDLSVKNKTIYRVLKWMVETGSDTELDIDEYEKILDLCVSVLINSYQDQTILPLVSDMIFRRNKKGRNIHDLVWAYFRLHDPNALQYTAQKLLSEDEEDINLACKLLHIEKTEDNQALYQTYNDWIKQNDPFLYFTNESMQFAAKPTFCRVDLERKYLGKGTPSYEKVPLTKLDENEEQALAVFNSLGSDEQELLSEMSLRLKHSSDEQWRNWLVNSVDEQLKMAKENKGVLI